MTVGDLKREVLVRHLETWASAALHRARRATYVHGYADADGGFQAEAALRVFAEQSDLVRGRELTMLAVGDDVTSGRSPLPPPTRRCCSRSATTAAPLLSTGTCCAI